MSNQTCPYPGIPALLDSLIAHGFKLAVVSNKFDGAVKELCARYFSSQIKIAVGERPGLQKKPAPDLIQKALFELQASPEGAVYVGDSDVDILTAQNAGLPCFSVSWGFRARAFLLSHGAVSISDTPEDLLHLLLK